MKRPSTRVYTRHWGDGKSAYQVLYRLDKGEKERPDSTWPRGQKKEAERRASELLKELHAETHVPRDEKWTVRQVWEDKHRGWLQELVATSRRQALGKGTLRNYKRAMEDRILPKFGDDAVSDLTSVDVQKWVDHLLDIDEDNPPDIFGRWGEVLKVKTVKGWVGVFRLQLGWAADKELGLRRNWLAGKDVIKYPPDDARIAVPLEAPDVDVVLLWIQRPRRTAQSANLWASARIAVLIALLAGLREGECCALDWGDLVNAERNGLNDRLMIWRSYSNHVDGMGPTKSRKKRTIPLAPVLHAALVAYWTALGRPLKGPILLDDDDKRMEGRALGTRHWPEAQARMGLIDPENKRQFHHRHRFHDLRHTAGSFWLAAGVPLDVVSRWLGHASIDTTWKIYMHQLEHDNRGLSELNQLSTMLVSRMSALGAFLPASEPQKLLPSPADHVHADAVAKSMAFAAPLPELTEYEQDVVELWRKGRYVHQIREELGGDNWRIAGLLERLGLKEKTKERNHTKRPDAVRARALERYQERNPDGRAKYNETAIALEAGLKSVTTLRVWVEQASIPLRRPEDRGKMGKRVLTSEERAEIVRRHRQGEKAIIIAVALHIGLTTVNRHLQNAAREEARDDELARLWLANVPAGRIGEQLGLSDVSVSRYAKRLGLPARGQGWKSWPLSDDPAKIRKRERVQRNRRAKAA